MVRLANITADLQFSMRGEERGHVILVELFVTETKHNSIMELLCSQFYLILVFTE